MKGNNGVWARASVAGAPFTANQKAQINREHIIRHYIRVYGATYLE